MFNLATRDLLKKEYHLNERQIGWLDYSLDRVFLFRILFGVIVDAF